LKVRVKFLATIRQITEEPEIELEIHPGDSVGAALQALQARYGTTFKEATTGTTASGIPKVRFLVNGRNTDFLEGLETKLKDGDVIVLIPRLPAGDLPRKPFSPGTRGIPPPACLAVPPQKINKIACGHPDLNRLSRNYCQ